MLYSLYFWVGWGLSTVFELEAKNWKKSLFLFVLAITEIPVKIVDGKPQVRNQHPKQDKRAKNQNYTNTFRGKLLNDWTVSNCVWRSKYLVVFQYMLI